MNQLVTFSTYTEVTAYHVFSRIFIEVIVQGLAPFRCLFTLQQRQEGFALHFFRFLDTCQVEDSRTVVDVLYEFGYITLLATRQTNEQRSAEGFFVHESLVEPTVFTHVETLVGSIDNHGIFQHALFFQIIQYTTDVAVNWCDDTQIVAHILLELPFSQSLSSQLILLELGDDWVIVRIPCRFLFRCHSATVVHATSPFFVHAAMDFIFLVGHLEVINDFHIVGNVHFLLLSGQASFVIVIEVFRQWEGLVSKKFEIASIRHPGTVRSLVVEEHTERFAFISLVLNPVDSLIGNDISGITFYLYSFSIHLDESRIVVIALSR